MFNSPTAYCPRCREYIALDERQRDCAAVHDCVKELCPLEKYFGTTRDPGQSAGRRRGELAAQSGATEPLGNPVNRAQ